MNENTLTGLYLNQFFISRLFTVQGKHVSLADLILQSNNGDLDQVKARLRNILTKDPKAFDYSDSVSHEILSATGDKNSYQETAKYFNHFASLMGVNTDLYSEVFDAIMQQPLFSRILPINMANNETNRNELLTSLFARQDFSNPAVLNYFIDHYTLNGVYRLNNQSELSKDQFIQTLNALDDVSQQEYLEKLADLQSRNLLPAGFQLGTVSSQKALVHARLATAASQQADKKTANNQSSAQSVAYNLVNRGVTNVIKQPSAQPSQPIVDPQNSEPHNYQSNRQVSYYSDALKLGQFGIGSISRDDLSAGPYIYLPTPANNNAEYFKNVNALRNIATNSIWDYGNGKYSWRDPQVAANSPVSVNELEKALGPFFATPNMESRFDDLLMDESGDKNNWLHQNVNPYVLTADGYDYHDYVKKRINGKKNAYHFYSSSGDQVAKITGIKSVDHAIPSIPMLIHNGHSFSPSDVSKAQFILKTAQDAGLDYDIRPGRNGQIVLKVNDNRGMQVTLLDIDNPSNIGSTRDRSGNQYEVDWTNVMISDGNRKRPVFGVVDRNGRIVPESRMEALANNHSKFDYMNAISTNYTTNYQVNYQIVDDLINSYNDANSKMDPGLRALIKRELHQQQALANVNGNSFPTDPKSDEYRSMFRNTVSSVMRKDGMRTYESLPADYQSFMATVPMIEALGIDTSRLNSFQELANKYHYTNDNMISYSNSGRYQRAITPVSVENVEMKAANLYSPVHHNFEGNFSLGLDLKPGQSITSDPNAGVLMRDSLYANRTGVANEYKMSTDDANQQIGNIYHDARVSLLDALNSASRSSDDQAMNDVLDRYDQLVTEVAKSYHLDLNKERDKQLLSASFAAVTGVIQNGKVDNKGISHEDYQKYVDGAIDHDTVLTDDQKLAAHGFAERLYRFVNSETGTSLLDVHDNLDHSQKHIQELLAANTDEVKAELDNLNWYQEYGYHTGDSKHIYLDTLQEFTTSHEPNAIRYSFDLVNIAKQTSPELYEQFAGHNAVNSKLIQQRMVNFDDKNQLYINELSQQLNPNRFDHEQAKNDWLLDRFNSYMLDHDQPIELDHLNEQYQTWLKNFDNIDVTQDVSATDGHQYTLTHGHIINEDGEVIDDIPTEAPKDWTKYFAGGKIMNSRSMAEEQSEVMQEVINALQRSQVEVDYVNLRPGRGYGKTLSKNQLLDAYTALHVNDDDYKQYRELDANGKPKVDSNDNYILSRDGRLELEKAAENAFQRNINHGAISPAVSIDKNGMIHWQGHSINLNGGARDVDRSLRYIRDLQSDDPNIQARGRLGLQSLGMDRISSQPAEGELGQFFLPDRRFIIHTNYHTFDSLSDEEKQAVQDHEVAGWKAVIQAPRELNQRGDLNPNDLSNFNSRLVLSSLPQVLRREIDENIRMQTAQLPATKAIQPDNSVGVILDSMNDHRSELLNKNRQAGFGITTKVGSNAMAVERVFSTDQLQNQLTQWYQQYVAVNGDQLSDADIKLLRQTVSHVAQFGSNGSITWDPKFIQAAASQINHVSGDVVYDDRILQRRNYTRPEDSTIVNKVYNQEVASTKVKLLPNGETIFDAKPGDSVRDQEIRNKSLLHLHARYRINNGPGEATSTRNVLADMEELEQAINEWQARHPGKQPYSTKHFEWEIKNRVHSRVQFYGGTNLGVLATQESLGYADLISTSQGKAQGRVRFLPEGSIVLPSGHVVPAEVPVPMTDEELEQYRNKTNSFATMTMVHEDPDNPGKMKTDVYKMSRFLDGTQLTKDKMFKYLSALPFDRSFIAIEQAAKANYIDQDATLALLNANLMNMEDGSVVSKAFAQKHQVYTPDGKLRPLEAGDKLSDTSGDKTTITQVIDPDMSMEEAEKLGIGDIVQFMKTTDVDIIKSPLSQISRKNMSQVQDMIDSFSQYNKETVKIHLPKRVTKAFDDANGHHYKVGDLMPKLDQDNYPIFAQPSQEERDAGLVQKPILTSWADHRKPIAELKKDNDNWLKFMNEGGPQAFKDGHKFIDVDGNEMKSWPDHPMFDYVISKDNQGHRVFNMKPALDYQLSDQAVDTAATIGNVTSFVTDILVDAKGNNYGIDPDASTEGRKYSDLVANADASRNATHLTQYLTSVNSDALPDFREYLKLAGFELSPDGKVFAMDLPNYDRDSLRWGELVKTEFNQDQTISSINDVMQSTGLSKNELQMELNDVHDFVKANLDSDVKRVSVPAIAKINWQNPSARDYGAINDLIKADLKFKADYQKRLDILNNEVSHPTEQRDNFTVDDIFDRSNDAEDENAYIIRAIGDANTKSVMYGSEENRTRGAWDLVSPLPFGKGFVDDPTRNINFVSSHQVIESPESNRLDYAQQVINAMAEKDPRRRMNKFASAEDAMNLYVRSHMVWSRNSQTQQNRINAIKPQSMIIKNGLLSQQQLATIGPLLDRIGLNMDDCRSTFADGLNKKNAIPTVPAVPDLNSVRQKNYKGQNWSKILKQMNPSKEFMEMIEGSNGGSLQLPDNLTVSLAGNPNSHSISILPQDLRRSRQSQANGTTTIDDYTRDYAQIGVGIKRYQVAMKALEVTMPAYPKECFTSESAFKSYQIERAKYLKAAQKEIWSRSGVQEAVDRIQDRMMTSTFGKDAGTIKRNFIREHIMSNRVKASSTAVQSNGYNLSIDTIEVSPKILKSLGMKYDKRTGYAYSPNPDDPKDRSWDMIHMHRDPVWRAHGSLGFRVKVNPSITGIRISPVVVSLMDGDFDGDTVGLIACADKGAQQDLHNQVNVLANVYNQSNPYHLGSTDMNVSGELIDLAGRSGFDMNMSKAFNGRMPSMILKQTGTTDADWQFGPLTKNQQDGKTSVVNTKLDSHSVAKLYAMAQKLYPNDSSLQKVKDDNGNSVNILEKDDKGQMVLSKTAMEKLNVKKVLKTYYALGLDVANRAQIDLTQNSKVHQDAIPQDGQMQWRDVKSLTNSFVNNTNHAIRTDNEARLAGAGINATSKETAKAGYQAIVDRGAKGRNSAITEMFSNRYIDNKPLYNQELQDYADKIKAFRDRVSNTYPEAMVINKNGNISFDLSKIEDPDERKSFENQFDQLAQQHLKSEDRQFFDQMDADTAAELDNLSMVQDATKEKSDSTGEPGGWHKKLVAAMADHGASYLAAANALGYGMTQATLQVKHDPVLAHKLADLEVNGMSKIYSGQYETLPLMLGLVGSSVVKSGPNLIVPLGKDTMHAGVNQRLLFDIRDKFIQNRQFMQAHYPDDMKLEKSDFSFHTLSKEDLQKVAKSLVAFAPKEMDGHEFDLDNLSDKDAIKLAEGFDQATRPMFSRWDPETGQQEDVKSLRADIYGRITPHELKHSVSELFEMGGVDKPTPQTLEYLTNSMIGMDSHGNEYIQSLKKSAENNAGTMMNAKTSGFKSIHDLAMSNTISVMQLGNANKTKSIFTNDQIAVSYQTRKQRVRSIQSDYQNAVDQTNKVMKEIAKSNTDPKMSQIAQATTKQLNSYQKQGKVLYAKLLADKLNSNKPMQTRLQNEKDPNGPVHQYVNTITKLGHTAEYNQQRLNQVVNAKDKYVASVEAQTLVQHRINPRVKDWKKAAAHIGYSDSQIKQIERELKRVSDKAAKQYDEKPIIWQDRKEDVNSNQFMNSVFNPVQFSNGDSSAAAVRISQKEFANNPAVTKLLKTNEAILQAVKDSHMEIGGLQKVADNNHNFVDKVNAAKHNCQRIANLETSPKKDNQKAYQLVKNSIRDAGSLGQFKNANRFSRLLHETLSDVTLAQNQLAVDPTVHNDKNTVDINQLSKKTLADFRQSTKVLLNQMNLGKEFKKNDKILFFAPTDDKPKAAPKAQPKTIDKDTEYSHKAGNQSNWTNNGAWYNQHNDGKSFGD